jgi:hypothetical protein
MLSACFGIIAGLAGEVGQDAGPGFAFIWPHR